MKNWQIIGVFTFLIIGTVLTSGCIDPGAKRTSSSSTTMQGSWLQLDFRAEVVGFTTDRPVEAFISNLSKKLDTEIVVVESTNPHHLEIRKYYSQAELEPILTSEQGKITSYQQGVSKSTAETVKRILENKINTFGTKDAKVNILTGVNDVAQYIRIELPGIDMKQAQEIVGKQGKFEIRIQTTGNRTEHILSTDSITSVQVPSQEPPGSDNWGVGFTLSESGADAFRAAAIKYGATADPANHNLIMLLDDDTVYSAPLSNDLAGKIQNENIRQLYASTGSGKNGNQQATNLEIHLKAGALPVDVTMVGSGDISASP